MLAEGVKGSVYAVAMNELGTLLAAGSPESAIRVIDPRTGSKLFKLKGHTDNIRWAGRLCMQQWSTVACHNMCKHPV